MVVSLWRQSPPAWSKVRHHAHRLVLKNPKAADFTQNILLRAIRTIVANFPVYRTYIDTNDQPTDADRRDLEWALRCSMKTAFCGVWNFITHPGMPVG
jgi:maltooligosyltrehalose synthase